MRWILPFADGVNGTELATVVELFHRADDNAEIVMPYVGHGEHWKSGVASSTPTRVVPNALLTSELAKEHWDAVVYVGGRRSVNAMLNSPLALDLARRVGDEGRPVAAICSAPLVLGAAGLLRAGQEVTSFQEARVQLEAEYRLVWLDRPVVRSEGVITGRGPGASIPFAFAVIGELLGVAGIRKADERFVSKAAMTGLREIEHALWDG